MEEQTVVLQKREKVEGNLSQGLVSCQNSFLVDQSMIAKPNSEQLSDGMPFNQDKQQSISEGHSSELKDHKSSSSPSYAKTKSARLEAFFSRETSKKSDPTSGQHQ